MATPAATDVCKASNGPWDAGKVLSLGDRGMAGAESRSADGYVGGSVAERVRMICGIGGYEWVAT